MFWCHGNLSNSHTETVWEMSSKLSAQKINYSFSTVANKFVQNMKPTKLTELSMLILISDISSYLFHFTDENKVINIIKCIKTKAQKMLIVIHEGHNGYQNP